MIAPVGLTGGLSLAQTPSAAATANPATSSAASEISGVAGGEATVPAGSEVSGASGGESFGSELSDAISSLEKTQQSSDAASQSLATGSAKDPEAAVMTVADAQLAMQLAAQLRTKATEAAQTIFQTQV